MTRKERPHRGPAASPTIIRLYQPSDRQAFVELNLDWIEEYFAVEDSDREQLERLETTILARGGQIVVAELDGRVVGTGAILPPHHDPTDGRKWLEIIKMSTAKDQRRQGIGRAVLQGLIAEAKGMQTDAIWLETNAALKSAVRLYELVGFQHLSTDAFWPSPYERCNVQMVLEL